jgi:hypothetical protein
MIATTEQMEMDIQSYFKDNFTGVDAAKIAWPAVDFTPPEDFTPWIRFHISLLPSQLKSFGPNKRYRRFGFISVQVFTKTGMGTKTASQISDDVIETLEGKQLTNGLQFEAGHADPVGDANGWYQKNVTIPFSYDTIKT